MVVATRLQINLDVLYPARAGSQVSSRISTEAQGQRQHAYEKTFWYSSGQLDTLPQAIRMWTRSQESSPSIQGLS